MCSEVAIKVEGLSKRFEIFSQPKDRLKQMIMPRLQRALSIPPKQYFQEFWAVRDVSFSVRKGQTIGIIGRNGSGKSTLLQIICGTLTPTTGEIQTNGKVAALLELGSGFNPEFTGRENVFLNAALYGLSREQTTQRFDDIAKFADIGDFIEQPVKTYSSGMMVRLAFAVIAHVDADILVIDEALAVGDAFFTQKCMRFLRNFMKVGTVLFVSHDTSSVRNLCTQAIWLDQGKVIQQGIPKEICDDYLEAFFEAQQGKSTSKTLKKEKVSPTTAESIRDQRDQFINHSNLRNDIQLFDFDPDKASFGKGGARIIDVQLMDEDKLPLSWIVGGEDVILSIVVEAESSLYSPIVGFFIKDKLGQALFGDNTYLSHLDNPIIRNPGQRFEAEFQFQIPRLANGDYSITVAIADGSQQEHIQHHWIHDAITFRAESTSVVGGLVGIPMKSIKMRKLNEY